MTDITADQKKALCASIRTTKYARNVVSLLRELIDSLYRTDAGDFETNLANSLDTELLVVLREILKDVDIKDSMNAEASLRTIIDFIDSVPEIQFVIPILPTKKFVTRLHEWCFENLGGEFFVELTTNRMMNSGLVMIYKGMYFEYSLENMLDAYFENYDVEAAFSKEADSTEAEQLSASSSQQESSGDTQAEQQEASSKKADSREPIASSSVDKISKGDNNHDGWI